MLMEKQKWKKTIALGETKSRKAFLFFSSFDFENRNPLNTLIVNKVGKIKDFSEMHILSPVMETGGRKWDEDSRGDCTEERKRGWHQVCVEEAWPQRDKFREILKCSLWWGRKLTHSSQMVSPFQECKS